MIDCHVHIERGDYTLEWIRRFVDTAIARNIDELWLLEHSYRFHEFAPMYDDIYASAEGYLRSWFDKKMNIMPLSDYLSLCEKVRIEFAQSPVKIKFGLEVCYFEGSESFVKEVFDSTALDFCTGSIHFIGNFAFDHKNITWDGVDVDDAYNRFFDMSVKLAQSGVFTGLAHPDSIKVAGYSPSFPLTAHYERLAAALAESGMYAEQNSGVSRRSSAECGMNREFVEILKKHGVRILTASDAHYPDDVGLLGDAVV